MPARYLPDEPGGGAARGAVATSMLPGTVWTLRRRDSPMIRSPASASYIESDPGWAVWSSGIETPSIISRHRSSFGENINHRISSALPPVQASPTRQP
jgi:hypothetical protein